MYKCAQMCREIGSGRDVLCETGSTSSGADKSFEVGLALAAEVKGVASAR